MTTKIINQFQTIVDIWETCDQAAGCHSDTRLSFPPSELGAKGCYTLCRGFPVQQALWESPDFPLSHHSHSWRWEDFYDKHSIEHSSLYTQSSTFLYVGLIYIYTENFPGIQTFQKDLKVWLLQIQYNILVLAAIASKLALLVIYLCWDRASKGSWLASNSWQCCCLSLLNDGITDVSQHAWLNVIFFKLTSVYSSFILLLEHYLDLFKRIYLR